MGAAEPLSLDIVLEGGGPHGGVQPIRMGIPFPKGRVRDIGGLRLKRDGLDVGHDLEIQARWSDGSVKWALLRFLAMPAEVQGGKAGPYKLVSEKRLVSEKPEPADAGAGETLKVRHAEGSLEIDTGPAVFTIDTGWLYPLRRAQRIARKGEPGKDLLEYRDVPDLLVDAAGKAFRFRIRTAEVEFAGRTQADILLEGDLVDAAGAVFCKGECRLFFFAGTSLAKIEFALWNPRPAAHPGGLWDLGDPGSVLFKSLRFAFPLASALEGTFLANLDPADPESHSGGQGPSPALAVHQSSSGNDTWNSLALVDRNNQPGTRFQGYRFTLGSESRDGKRANPTVVFSPSGPGKPAAIALAMESFWETFPNRLSAESGSLVAEPFPAAEAAEFELQGGEMAATTLWLDFAAQGEPASVLPSARTPIVPRLDPSVYCASGCFPYVAAPSLGADGFWNGLGKGFLDGPSSIYARRERCEEFGWRNFGEFPADHERLHYQGDREFISHYNNQYDWILAGLSQFAGGGDPRWFTLAADLGRHVMHIDLYRTQGDKSAYNGGYFWHTAHYMHAGTATHRSYSTRATENGPIPPGFGGGPSNEHNYTTGLLLYHYLTGDRRARRCLVQLADWVENMQDGSKTVFRFLSANPTGFATSTRDLAYQGPGRGCGYSINACLDALALTGERRWLDLAEKYLRTCMGPADDPDALELLDRERRWSYVVFLQSLGKFLDVKLERNETDAGFDHARACLLKLADWMAEKEYPYLDRPADLEFPTSTWAAQDLRKVCVFLFAAKYGAPRKQAAFRAKADAFLAAARGHLAGYDDRDSIRNMVLILNTVPMHAFAASAAESWNLGLEEKAAPMVAGLRFVPQKIQAMARAKKIVVTLGLASVPIALKLGWQIWSARRKGGKAG